MRTRRTAPPLCPSLSLQHKRPDQFLSSRVRESALLPRRQQPHAIVFPEPVGVTQNTTAPWRQLAGLLAGFCRRSAVGPLEVEPDPFQRHQAVGNQRKIADRGPSPTPALVELTRGDAILVENDLGSPWKNRDGSGTHAQDKKQRSEQAGPACNDTKTGFADGTGREDGSDRQNTE